MHYKPSSFNCKQAGVLGIAFFFFFFPSLKELLFQVFVRHQS